MSIKLQRQQAYEKIKRAIVTLRFEMGKNINEQDLCQELNLGRTPVREALQLLASEGLVIICRLAWCLGVDTHDLERTKKKRT